MALAFQVGPHTFEIGSPSFLNAFFSTVFVLVENEDWGSRFPAVMNDLYSGQLEPCHAADARDELTCIRNELSKFSATCVVWDFENRDLRPPWGGEINTSITSMADYFVTSDGKDLIDVLDEALSKSGALGVPLVIS